MSDGEKNKDMLLYYGFMFIFDSYGINKIIWKCKEN